MFPGETEQHFVIPLMAGVAARVFSVSVVSPLELIRTKMQSQKLSYYGEFRLTFDECWLEVFIGGFNLFLLHVLDFQTWGRHWKVLLQRKEYSDFGVGSVRVYFVTCHFLVSIGWFTNRWKYITMLKCPHSGSVFLVELFQEAYVRHIGKNWGTISI